MNSMQLLSEYVANDTTRKWSDELLRTMPRARLNQIAAWTEGLVKVDPEVGGLIRKHGAPTMADRLAAMSLAKITMVDRMLYNNPEENVVTKGGSLIYSPVETTVHKLNNTVEKWDNSPVPYAEVPLGRENIASVAALCSQVVVQSAGEWKPLSADWIGLFGKDGMSPSDLTMLGKMVAMFCSNADSWTTLPAVDKNAITGIKQLSFVRNVLASIDLPAYHFVNTTIVLEVLRAFEKEGKTWHQRLDTKGVVAVPESCYKEVQVTAKMRKGNAYELFRKKGFPKVFLYMGGFVPKLDLPCRDGTLAATLATAQKIRQVAGANNSAMLMLATMKGYSGFSSDMGKRLHFLLSATLTAWHLGFPVDIRLSADGDIGPLYSSLKHWEKIIKEGKDAQSNEFFGEMLKIEGEWLKFVPLKSNATFHAVMAPFISYQHRKEAVAVCYNATSLPTSGEKKVVMDYDGHSQQILPVGLPPQYIFYSCIYGIAPFPGDKECQVQSKKRGSDFKFLDRANVYAFSNAFSFCGILSSFRDLQLVGFGYAQEGKEWNLKVPQRYVTVPLRRLTLLSDWYNQVAADAAAAVLNMFTAVRRYSPITNFLYVTKKAVATALLILDSEGDAYVSQVLQVKRKARGSELADSFEDGGLFGGGEGEDDDDSSEAADTYPLLPLNSSRSSTSDPLAHVTTTVGDVDDKYGFRGDEDDEEDEDDNGQPDADDQ